VWRAVRAERQTSSGGRRPISSAVVLRCGPVVSREFPVVGLGFTATLVDKLRGWCDCRDRSLLEGFAGE
jgi:hypothetical protein